MNDIKSNIIKMLKENGPMTTEGIQRKSFLMKSEYCMDSILSALVSLVNANKIEKIYSKEHNAYVWRLKT